MPQRAQDRPSEASSIRTFLIADVRGYTRFSHKHGDEAAARLTAQFADVAAEAVEAHGGEVVEQRGDEVLAVFGSARRAIKAAVELQDVLAAESSAGMSTAMVAGVGLDAGEAVPVAGGYRGRALNLAARLCARAEGGEVLASSQVVHLAGAVDGINYRSVGYLELKGLESPVEVTSLTSDGVGGVVFTPQPAPARTELPRELDQITPLVGREPELRRLRWVWRRARAGHGNVCTLIGPSGIGKTRLVAELAAEVHAAGWTVVYGRGAGPVGDCLAALQRMQDACEPALVILDDVDVCGGTVLDRFDAALAELASRAVLFIATMREMTSRVAGLADRDGPGGAERVELGGLDAGAVAAIAELYAPGGHGDLPVAGLVEQTNGVPGLVHRRVGEWLTERAAAGVDEAVTRSAKGRPELVSADAAVARSVADLEFVRERSRLYATEAARLPAICPFKGLASFQPEDAEYFFGREALVAEMTARVVGATFLGVVGPSGSGKSSVVRAGLVASLNDGILPGSSTWRTFVMRPGQHPLAELDNILDSESPGANRDVLVVDQFEEIYTTSGESERQSFVRALVDLSTNADTLVVLVVRADYYGRCAAYPDLARLFGRNHVLVGPMDADALRRAVELPARRAGLMVEPGLVGALVDDVVGEPGALPLMSACLLDLWRRRDGPTLSEATYEASGGVRGSIAGLAEGAYAELTAEQQVRARQILLRLSSVGDGGAAVRRRAPMGEIGVDDDPDVARAIEVLTSARLLTASEGSIEVAHEALLREWPRLREWLDQDADGRRLQMHLINAAGEWQEHGRDTGDLYRGERLAAALDWTTGHDPELSPLEREFMVSSRAFARREVRRLRLLLSGAVVLLLVACVAAGAALIQRGHAQHATTVADARGLGAEALTQPLLGRALLLAREAVNLDDTLATRDDLFAALLRGRDATWQLHIPGGFPSTANTNQITVSPDGRTLAAGNNTGIVRFYSAADHRLAASVSLPHQAVASPTASSPAVSAIAYSPSGSQLWVATDPDTVTVIDTQTHKTLGSSISVPDSVQVNRLVFEPDGRLAIMFENRQMSTLVRLFHVRTRSWSTAAVAVGLGTYNVIDDLSYSARAGTLVATQWVPPGAPTPGVVELLDPRTLQQTLALRMVNVTQAVISPDGKSLAIARDDGTVLFRDLATGRVRVAAGQQAQGIWSAAFTPNGTTLVTTSDDHTVALWSVTDAREEQVLNGHGDQVVTVAMAPEGDAFYTGSLDGTVIAWSTVGNPLLERQRFFTTPEPQYTYQDTAAAAISPDNTTLALSPRNNIVQLWNLHTLAPTTTLKGYPDGQIASLEYSPNGFWLAADAGLGSQIVVWDVRTGRVAQRIAQSRRQPAACAQSDSDPKCAGYGLDFSQRGSLLATGDASGGTRVVNVQTHRSVYLPAPRPVTGVEWSPDGTRLAACECYSPRETYQLWDMTVRPAKLITTFRVLQGNYGHGLAFSTNGDTLAVGNPDEIDLRSAHTGRLLTRLPLSAQQNGGVVAWSRDGRTLAVTAGDGVELWDTTERTEIGTLPLSTKPFNANLLFTPDGRHLAAVTNDGIVTIWDVDPRDWEAAACTIAGRNLTREEWSRYVPDRSYSTVCS